MTPERKENRSGFLGYVEGLRGIAIGLVVLFHLQGSFWTHGYLGVDVFLVISGYLLFRSAAAQERPDGWREVLLFAWRRVQRIVPGMAVVVILAVALGLLFLIPEDELFLSQEGIKALQGSVNSFLAKEFSNYFASDSAFNPLLHLWYLAVILQVYLMWAVGKPILQRVPRRWAVAVLWLVGVASLLRCYSFPVHEWLREMGAPVWKQKQDISYYATLPRVWEVLAGGIVLLLPGLRRRWASVATGAGVLGILLPALVGAVPGLSWLGSAPCTFIVVVSTLLVLRYAPEGHLEQLLSNKPLRWVGKVSFSIYLVHMPLIVYGKMWVFNQPSTVYLGGIAVASILFGACAWWIVEKRRFPWWAVATLWGMAFLFCRAGRKSDGFQQFAKQIVVVNERKSYEGWQMFDEESALLKDAPPLSLYGSVFHLLRVNKPESAEKPYMRMGDAAQTPSVVLLGDSHAAHSYAGLNELLKEEHKSGVYVSTIVIPFEGWIFDHVDDLGKYEWNAQKEQEICQWLERHPELTHVCIAQYWQARYGLNECNTPEKYADPLRRFCARLRELGKNVVIMGQTPTISIPMRHLRKLIAIRRLRAEDISTYQTREEYLSVNADVLAALRMVEEEGLCTVVQPVRTLAPGEVFHSAEEGVVLMVDRNHLSWEGSIRLMKRLKAQVMRALE